MGSCEKTGWTINLTFLWTHNCDDSNCMTAINQEADDL